VTEPTSTDGPDAVEPSIAVAGVARAERLCLEAILAVDVDGAGLSIMTSGGHRGTVCATDEVALRIEDLQFSLGEGPCFEAFTGAGPVFISDLDATTAGPRWPMFTEAVAAAGVRALFAFPLLIGAIPLGALDLYRLRPEALSPHQLREAWRLANTAAGALLDIRPQEAMDLPVDAAPAGASYRLEVHQATGMASVHLGSTLEEAFLRLRAYAFARDLDVTDVAREIVDGRLRLSPDKDDT
jgi:hypothetical protein